MSLEATSWAWGLKLRSPMLKLVVLALADFADSTGGSCFPSHKTLASRCSASKDAIRRSLKSLEEMGAICRHHRLSRADKEALTSDSYALNLGWEVPAKNAQGVGLKRTGCGTTSHRGVGPHHTGVGAEEVRILQIEPPDRTVQESTNESGAPRVARRPPQKISFPADWRPSPEDVTFFELQGFAAHILEQAIRMFARQCDGRSAEDWSLEWRRYLIASRKHHQAPKGRRA